jgi:sugar lactone lactonase YvrE
MQNLGIAIRGRSMKKALSIFFTLFLLSIFVGAQKIEMVEGVRVVHNEKGGKWGKNPEVAIKLIRTIGDVDTEDENLAFNSPSDIAMDSAGNIYILDSGNQRIQKFSPEGKYLATIGRKGQGPAEFVSPSSLDIDSKGYLYVLDPNQGRLQILTLEGKEFKIIHTLEHDLRNIRVLGSGLFVARSRFRRGAFYEERKSLPKLLKLIDSQMNVLKEFGDMFDYRENVTNEFGNSVFFEVDRNDNIYLSFYYQNRIEKYSPDGRFIWKADRALNYSTELIEKGKLETTATSQKFFSPKMNQCSNGIAVDKRDRVWALTLNRQIKKEEIVVHSVSGGPGGITKKTIGNTDLRTTDMYKLEIFTADGILLGEIPLNHFADSIRIIEDNLFLFDRDRGVKYYQYKIIEK